MNYEIVTTDDFERHFKQLSKKYCSLDSDYEIFIEELLKNPTKKQRQKRRCKSNYIQCADRRGKYRNLFA